MEKHECTNKTHLYLSDALHNTQTLSTVLMKKVAVPYMSEKIRATPETMVLYITSHTGQYSTAIYSLYMPTYEAVPLQNLGLSLATVHKLSSLLYHELG